MDISGCFILRADIHLSITGVSFTEIADQII